MQSMYSSNHSTGSPQLKESIRDMIRLQQRYQLSDELFWELFNARVLMNENIYVEDFLTDMNNLVGNA